MADTYTEGYRIGFITCNKDISKKSVVQVLYPLGFERMIRAALKISRNGYEACHETIFHIGQ